MSEVNSTTGLLKEKGERYLSLDILRGMTIALMILVNTPGSWSAIYGPFQHAPWHGFTITDMVFPSFLFVVGNAMSFSMKKFGREHQKEFLQKVFRRTALIFLIGLFLNAYPFVRLNDGELTFIDLTSLRLFGVLQRIALCYCIASLAVFYFSIRGIIIFSAISLLGYWGVMYFFGDPSGPYSLNGNAALKLDLLIIGAKNMYKGEGIPFDPEGILSTFPAAINVVGGYFTGKYIQANGNNKSTVVKLILGGLALTALGMLWDLAFPINKKIWTSSYVLFTIGLNILVIAVIMYVVEVAKLKKWAYFFEAFGKNPLVLYALSGMIIKTMSLIRIDGQSLQGWIYNNLLHVFEPRNASLLFAILYTLLIWVIGYYMDRRKIYIKV